MFRVATFNVENLDDKDNDKNPALSVRAPVLRSTLNRLQADILCLQEVHGQERADHTSANPSRELSALDFLLTGTPYFGYHQATTLTTDHVPYNLRNLVILSAHPITKFAQYRNDHIDALRYRKVTATDPPDIDAKDLGWERPILYAQIEHPQLGTVHVLNLHLKSRLASHIPGQKTRFSWKSAAGWAEGYFLSSIKRVGQALETRILVDKLFDADVSAQILVCGDFNAEPGEVPVEAICGRVENTSNPELRSRVLVPCNSSIPSSIRFSHYHHGQGNLLDHMLISQSLLPYFRRSEIYNENLHDESLPYTYDSKYPESDHAAFVSEFASAE
ncbi:MAG: endonuclease/exonuclease/phosphatase family protein [Nitrospiria bacterium]